MKVTCPILAVDLPGVSDLKLQGLIVVVGPNSSGKTQFLHDIDEAVCGKRRELVVGSGMTFKTPPPFDEYFSFLVERGSIREQSPDQFLKSSLQYGADAGAGSFRKTKVKSQHQQFELAVQQKVEGVMPDFPFLMELGPLTCSALFLKNRLSLMDACPTFDYRSHGPSKTLQALYWNKIAKVTLHREIASVFQLSVWVDNTRHSTLVVRVSDSPNLPSAEERLEPELMETYRTIETEGDGLRSYCSICATLLLEARPLCIVDEPEMCLHPPQAYAMGRFIGAHTSDETCTIVATHSSHVLRGILETQRKANVIRLTHVSSAFRACLVTPKLLEQATSKPRSRSETILEGLLSHVVILCEAEGDRLVYGATYRTLSDRRLDVRFVPSGGTGGFADPLRLYRALEVPCAVIADLDFLAKEGELKKVLKALGTPPEKITSLCKSARNVISQVKGRAKQTDIEEVQKELRVLADGLAKNIDDAKVGGKLQSIGKRLYKLHALQQKGLEAIPETYDSDGPGISRSAAAELLKDLERQRLFLVPVGELESWLPVVMKGQSREDKSKWAMLAAEKIEDGGERDEGIWEFMRRVYRFLVDQMQTLSEKPSNQEDGSGTIS